MKIIDHLKSVFKITTIDDVIEEEEEKYINLLARTNPRKRARDTIGWWMAHHYGKMNELIETLSEDMAAKERIPPEAMKKEAIPYLLKAAEYHNLAEKEGISKEEEKMYWQLAEEALIEYYTTVKKLRWEYWKDAFVAYVTPGVYMMMFGLAGALAVKLHDPILSPLLSLTPLAFSVHYLKATHQLDRWWLPEEKINCKFADKGPIVKKEKAGGN